MYRRILYTAMVASVLGVTSGRALAAAHCEELGGQVIFRDSMYGTGIGVVGSSLYVLASENYEKPGKKIATGGLLGFGLGFGLGILELSMRDCDSSWKSFSWKPFFYQKHSDDGHGSGVTLTYRF